LQIPIFKGLNAETLEIETFAQINGREISFILISPGAQAVIDEIRDSIIDAELEKIRKIAPDIAIIEQ
jgi:2-hydroxy-3-keto-5-methylthiopentenyl-1-phosphate phosphatase